MWLKKHPKEFAAERNSILVRNVFAALAFALIVVRILFLDARNNFPNWVWNVTVLACGVYLQAFYRRRHWHNVRASCRVCQQCNRETLVSSELKCVCGGDLYPLALMEWVELEDMLERIRAPRSHHNFGQRPDYYQQLFQNVPQSNQAHDVADGLIQFWQVHSSNVPAATSAKVNGAPMDD